MADYDVLNDVTPANPDRRNTGKPTIAALKTALSTFSGTTYTAAVLAAMTRDDMIYACRINSLTVTGL